MTLEERLRAILAALPDGASITLPVQLLSEWLDDGDYDPLSDFTVAQVATQLGRSPGTVRAWIRSGGLEAYRLGKEYRITHESLMAFRDVRRCPHAKASDAGGLDGKRSLSAWRRLPSQRA